MLFVLGFRHGYAVMGSPTPLLFPSYSFSSISFSSSSSSSSLLNVFSTVFLLLFLLPCATSFCPLACECNEEVVDVKKLYNFLLADLVSKCMCKTVWRILFKIFSAKIHYWNQNAQPRVFSSVKIINILNVTNRNVTNRKRQSTFMKPQFSRFSLSPAQRPNSRCLNQKTLKRRCAIGKIWNMSETFDIMHDQMEWLTIDNRERRDETVWETSVSAVRDEGLF